VPLRSAIRAFPKDVSLQTMRRSGIQRRLLMAFGSDRAVAQSSVLSPAPVGAILCGLVWTAVDTGGIERLSFRAVWTAVDVCGHGLYIYGSGGWGFESLRACYQDPCMSEGF
jgi:hypothetical protein